MNTPKHIQFKLQKQEAENALRKLLAITNPIDFSSNDYLGIAKSSEIFELVHHKMINSEIRGNGATGSRLLTGNNSLYDHLEKKIAQTHGVQNALVFNSGYTANLGFFSTVPQRNDYIVYDQYAHASIRDGIKLSNAKSFSFKHNSIEALTQKLQHIRTNTEDSEIYVITESVFSMDGDTPDLIRMIEVCEQYNSYLIVDEAHAIGVFGLGLTSKLNLQKRVWAQIVTFGKAIGCHGAAVLCNDETKTFLVNFSRPFIYTTGLTPHSLMTIQVVYEKLFQEQVFAKEQEQLKDNIIYFRNSIRNLQLEDWFITSNSAIQSCIISGNTQVKQIANELQIKGFDVRPILSPTVPIGEERLRFCIHSYNTKKQIDEVLSILSIFASCKKNISSQE